MALADDIRAVLDEGTAPGSTSWAATNRGLVANVQQLYNMVAGLGSDNAATKAQLDAIRAELDKVATSGAGGVVDLSGVYSRVDALSKHLGVGTA